MAISDKIIKVMLVDDSAVVRQTLTEVLSCDKQIKLSPPVRILLSRQKNYVKSYRM